MDIHAYEVLPSQFRKAFEEVNGELPESEFIRNIWMDIAVKWFAGWCLAVEHASELRPETPPLPEPEPVKLRHFMLTVGGEGSFIARETSAFGGPVHAPVVMQSDNMREYVSSLEDYRPENNVFQQEPAPFPVPPPPPMPGTHSQAPKAPVTAAEAAAASVESVASRKFIIINASLNPDNSWRWLVEVEEKELVKRGTYASREEANAALKGIEGAELMGSIYAISDERLRFWQQNPNLLYIAREEFATVRGEKPPRG